MRLKFGAKDKADDRDHRKNGAEDKATNGAILQFVVKLGGAVQHVIVPEQAECGHQQGKNAGEQKNDCKDQK